MEERREFAERDAKPSVLGYPATRGATPTGFAVAIVGVCIALAMGILFLVGLALENWLRDRAAAPAPVAVEQKPSPAAIVKRSTPSPDPRLANAKLRGNPAMAFGPDAYPVEAIRNAEQGRVVARLQIDASGSPTSCQVETSSGSRSLDDRTCKIAMRRVRFDPARDSFGTAIPSTYLLPVRWVLPADSRQTSEERDDRIPLWPVLAVFGLAGYEIYTLRKGLLSGQMSAPRGGAAASRSSSPGMFVFYKWAHITLIAGFGGGGLFLLADYFGLS